MNKLLLRIFLLSIFIVSAPTIGWTQCANDNVLVAGDLTPPGVTLSTTQTYVAGEYVLATVVAGANYTVSTCSNTSFDTQLTVYDDATGTMIAYNDDFCGAQSTTSFTPTFCGLVRVLVDEYFCLTSSSSMDVTMTMNSAGSGLPTLVAAPDVQACIGDQVSIGIANNGTGGTLPYAYSWNPPINLSTAIAPITTVNPVTISQPYDLTLTDANGCMARDTIMLTALPLPVVFLGNDTTICGGPLLLNAGNPGSTYLWSTGAGTQTLSITQSGTYSVAVQNLNGCIGTDAITVTINPMPTVSLGLDTLSCSNSVTLDAGSGYASYNWSTGDITQTTNVLVTGLVAVTVSNSFGCTATDTTLVTLSPPPAVMLGADITQCGGSVLLDAGNPGSLYFWSNSTSAQTTTVTTSGTYSVQVITPQGCTSSDTIGVTINSVPTTNLGPDTTFCTATITLDAGNVGCTYLWNTFATSQTITVGSGTYYVGVTNASGCFDTDTINVTAGSAPSISAGPNQTICPTQIANLTATGGLTYLWSTGATTASIAVSPTIATTYYVTGFDINGCSASETVSVSVLPLSVAQFTDVVIGATAICTNLSSNAVSYTWNFGDASGTSNAANPSHTYTVNGTYTITLTVTGPCGTDVYTQVVVITQVGLQDNDLATTLSLFPNPNDGTFTLSFEFANAKDVTVEVLDVTGRVIFADKESEVTSYNKQIGLEEAQSGMYFVRIITNEGVVTEKMIIQR